MFLSSCMSYGWTRATSLEATEPEPVLWIRWRTAGDHILETAFPFPLSMGTVVCTDNINITRHRMLPLKPLPLLLLEIRYIVLSTKLEWILYGTCFLQSQLQRLAWVCPIERAWIINMPLATVKLRKWISDFHSERSTY